MNDYYVDVSRLFQEPKSAVHFSEAEDANAFFSYMINHHPNITQLFSRKRGSQWDEYKEETSYTFFGHGSNYPDTMTKSSFHHFIRKGFEIIPGEEVVVRSERQKDIEESGMDIEFLFGT